MFSMLFIEVFGKVLREQATRTLFKVGCFVLGEAVKGGYSVSQHTLQQAISNILGGYSRMFSK